LKRVRFAKIRLWQWIGFGLFVAAGVLLGWLTQKALDRIAGLEWPWVRAVAEAVKGPGSMALGLWIFVLGIAAQRVLGNLFAGLLLAVTQPVKSSSNANTPGNLFEIRFISTMYSDILSPL
jgi:hypothetical protein